MATKTCPTCGGENPARAKFCADCGSPMGAGAGAGTPAGAPRATDPVRKWFVAGTVVLAVQTAAIILALRRPVAGAPASQASQTEAGTAGAAGTGGMTDLSSMTPREAADRLFDRVMRASEAGDTGQVAFFGPMAVQAYGNVTPLDADARLHIGMIQLTIGAAAAARAQADSITRTDRTHLFGSLLKARAALARNDRAAAQTAWREFLANYDAERAKGLPEYDQHTTMLVQARQEAQTAGGGRGETR